MWNSLAGPGQTALEVAMKHMMGKCPFLSKNPGLMASNAEVLRRLAARCPVMSPVVDARKAAEPEHDGVAKFLDALDRRTMVTLAQPAPLSECPSGEAHNNHNNNSQHNNNQHNGNGGVFDYKSFFHGMVDKKKKDNSYRVFNSVNRIAAQYPKADTRSATHPVVPRSPDVTVWCSNDYLGMSRHPDVVNAVVQSVRTHGVGAGGTRNISGTTMHHELLESDLAALHQKEAALVFSSCFVANDATLSVLGSHIPNMVFFSDASNHSSMIEKQFDKSVPKIVAFETVYSMSGSISPLSEMCDLAHEYNALTFVDEVHAVGMYGATGAGVGEMYGVLDKMDIISGTLAKAYGVIGGYIAGSKEMVDTVRSYAPGFIFTTSLPPMICAAARESVSIVRNSPHLREQQQANTKLLKAALRKTGIPFLENPSHIVPVLVGNAKICKQISDELLMDHHIYVQSINYPTVGTERLRITPGPLHTPEMTDELVSALVAVWHKHRLPFVSPSEHITEHYFQHRK